VLPERRRPWHVHLMVDATSAPGPFPFLSDEWVERVQEVGAVHAGNMADLPGLVVNARVVVVPFAPEGRVELEAMEAEIRAITA
jgi:hypothetical protein